MVGIRLARVNDRRGIQRLLDQLEYPGSESFLETKLERMVKDPEEVLLVWEEEGPGAEGGVADRGEGGAEDGGGEEAEGGGEGGAGGRILGLLSLHFIPQIAVEGDFARISYFAVDEGVRNGGIGRMMEAHATKLAREKGCRLIEVHCHERRERAHEFYFRQGYVESPKYLIKRLL